MGRGREKGRPQHDTPGWVGPGSRFFLTICCDRPGVNQLCVDGVGAELLEGLSKYQRLGRWDCRLGLLMPDHLHVIVGFPEETEMVKTVGDWKKFQARELGIRWQSDFFDYRLRGDGEEEKRVYILENPVRAGLCERAEDWEWVYPAR